MVDLSMFDVTGKIALVTGGAMGLGRSCAQALALAGASVAIVDLNGAVGTVAAESLQRQGMDATFVKCDVADKVEVANMVAAVVKKYGRIDIAINNAGFGIKGGNSENLDLADWDRVIAVNMTGVFLCAQAEAQAMLNQQPIGGKIINVASMYGMIAGGNCAYNTAKAGCIHLTRSLAAEWGRYNINVNCISPSWTMTPAMISTSPDMRARMRQVTPLGHVQRPEDIQGAVIFLASNASNFVTGHNLVVDGGHTLNTWLTPLDRVEPPRVNPREEVHQALIDLNAMGFQYADENAFE